MEPNLEIKKQTSLFKGSSMLQFLNNWGTIIAIILLVIFFFLTMPQFFSGSNILNILRSISIVTVIAIGLTVSLAVNGFD